MMVEWGSSSLRKRQRASLSSTILTCICIFSSRMARYREILPAAHEKDPPHLGGVAAQKAEELIQAGGTADEVEIIPCLGDKGAVGDDDLAVPVYGAEQEGELFDLAGQVLKRIAHQKVFLHQAEAHQLHPAPTEGLDIGGGGKRSSREISTAVAFSGLMTMSMPRSRFSSARPEVYSWFRIRAMV